MTNPNDPAFPSLEKVEQYDDDQSKYVDILMPMGGLSKREFFAAMAMQAWISQIEALMRGEGKPIPDLRPIVAQAAVNSADALIAELNKPVPVMKEVI